MKIFPRYLIGLVLILFHSNLYSQNYFPVDPGNSWYYNFFNNEVIQTISPPIYKYNGQNYQALIDTTPEKVVDSSRFKSEGQTYHVYKKGKTGLALDTIYIRKDTDGNIYWFDRHSNIESLYVPSKPKKGKVWKSPDNRFQFKIVSLVGSFKSDSLVFTNCLVISKTSLTKKDDATTFHYFSEGIGQVGFKQGRQIVLSLIKMESSNAR